MKIILLNDIDSHKTDAVFCVPDEVSSNDVDSYIENCRNIAERFGVSMCGIYNTEIFKNLEDIENLHSQISTGFDCVGTICVDAGLAGFFENKPDFTNDEWSHFCDLTFGNETDNDFKVIDNCAYVKNGSNYKCFFTSSGEGDGNYHVNVLKNKNSEIVAINIEFI